MCTALHAAVEGVPGVQSVSVSASSRSKLAKLPVCVAVFKAAISLSGRVRKTTPCLDSIVKACELTNCGHGACSCHFSLPAPQPSCKEAPDRCCLWAATFILLDYVRRMLTAKRCKLCQAVKLHHDGSLLPTWNWRVSAPRLFKIDFRAWHVQS